jgi:hypothetical protein
VLGQARIDQHSDGTRATSSKEHFEKCGVIGANETYTVSGADAQCLQCRGETVDATLGLSV